MFTLILLASLSSMSEEAHANNYTNFPSQISCMTRLKNLKAKDSDLHGICVPDVPMEDIQKR